MEEEMIKKKECNKEMKSMRRASSAEFK
jgi:hypothetical protein